MSYIIPEEELTTDGPYRLGDPRPLTRMEVAYSECMVQFALLDAMAQLAAAADQGDQTPRPSALGVRSASVTLPDALATGGPTAGVVSATQAGVAKGPLG